MGALPMRVTTTVCSLAAVVMPRSTCAACVRVSGDGLGHGLQEPGEGKGRGDRAWAVQGAVPWCLRDTAFASLYRVRRSASTPPTGIGSALSKGKRLNGRAGMVTRNKYRNMAGFLGSSPKGLTEAERLVQGGSGVG